MGPQGVPNNATIRPAVADFHRRVQADPVLRPYFPPAGLPRRERQLAAVLGAPDQHDPRRVAGLLDALPIAALSSRERNLLGHYLLSALHDQRVGPDMLVAVTVLLTSARRASRPRSAAAR
jgi:truncated hemoglobin YjbI